MRQPISLASGERREVNLVLPPERPPVLVRVTDDAGEPLAGARVTLLSLDPEDQKDLPEEWKARLKRHPGEAKRLKESLKDGRSLDWDLVLPLVKVPHDDHYLAPMGNHGTHVAGPQTCAGLP